MLSLGILPGSYGVEVSDKIYPAYISRSLSTDTKERMLTEISKPKDPIDEQEWIYIYTIESTESYFIIKTLAKIERTSNVTMRQSQWQTQWGYSVKLFDATKVVVRHKVERLVHVELRDKQVKGPLRALRNHSSWMVWRHEWQDSINQQCWKTLGWIGPRTIQCLRQLFDLKGLSPNPRLGFERSLTARFKTPEFRCWESERGCCRRQKYSTTRFFSQILLLSDAPV